MQNYTDTLDLRDLADEWAELLTEREDADADTAEALDDEVAEFIALGKEFYGSKITTPDDLRHQGDHYDPTLINEDYFEEYAEDLANDLGLIDKDAGWPASFIDWSAAAEALKQDYMTVEFRGQNYLIRA